MMRKSLSLFVLLLIVGSAAFAETPEGFTSLFNGKDLSGWYPIQRDFSPYRFEAFTEAERTDFIAKNQPQFDAHWRVENGELVNDGQGPYAATAKNYKDFELLIEYKTVPSADSGIYLRGCPQVQIWNRNVGSGGLYNNQKNPSNPLVNADKPFGQWNSYRIVLKGNVCNVWLNGQQVVKDTIMENYFDRSKDLPETGSIQLQTHGGEIRWRNIFIKEL